VWDEKRRQLLQLMESYGTCAVAFSGGVDSAVVAKAAVLALGERAVAVTGVSSSLAAGELESARQLARMIGIRHVELSTGELSNPDYLRNAADRCFHCKTELYSEMAVVAAETGCAVLVNGANADDLGDYRPGMEAARRHGVESPLAQCGLSKSDVRRLAAEWSLPVWNKPATPCLSSRIAYGVEVTEERLARIDAAERYLRDSGFETVRVRLHENDLARIEIPTDSLARICSDQVLRPLLDHLKQLGFRFMTLDLEGFRSGSLNTLVPAETLRRVVLERRADGQPTRTPLPT
jgi:uncharacterized protein